MSMLQGPSRLRAPATGPQVFEHFAHGELLERHNNAALNNFSRNQANASGRRSGVGGGGGGGTVGKVHNYYKHTHTYIHTYIRL
jgi:hypothetical protein